MSAIEIPPLLEMSARDLSDALSRREVRAVDLMTATLERIEAVNPAINAIVSLRPREELEREAAAADALLDGMSDAEARRGWLLGIPMAIKDTVDVAGIRSTQGSPLFAEHRPERDAGLVRQLRSAGAIVIGKTNVPEFAVGSHTVNPVFGATANPFDSSRSAGGSSGGAAAALASRMVCLADGSDMMGSLRNPAGWCGVWALRPTWGVVPPDPGSEAFLHPLSTVGPMARNPADLAALFGTMAVDEVRVPFGRAVGSLDLSGADARGVRIGWLRDWGGAYPMEVGIVETCEAALHRLAGIGCDIEEVNAPFPAADLWRSWTVLRSFALAAKFRPLYDDPAARAALKPEILWEVERGLALTAMKVHEASELRSAWFARAAELFERVDVLALPTAQLWPFPKAWRYPEEIAGQEMDTYHRWMEVVVPGSLIGAPCLAMPAGHAQAETSAQGLPIGLQLIGPLGGDRALLRLGQAAWSAGAVAEARPFEQPATGEGGATAR